MANIASNIVAPKPAIAGGVYVAPLATALPTDSTTALVSGYTGAGYIDAKGVEEDNGGKSTKIHAWGGVMVKVVRGELDVSYHFVLMELMGKTANEIVYGVDNVTTTAATATAGNATAVLVNDTTLPNQIFVFDMIDGLASVRIVIPNGQVTEVGKTTYSESGAAMYDVTVSAYPDDAGNNAYKYMNDGQTI